MPRRESGRQCWGPAGTAFVPHCGSSMQRTLGQNGARVSAALARPGEEPSCSLLGIELPGALWEHREAVHSQNPPGMSVLLWQSAQWVPGCPICNARQRSAPTSDACRAFPRFSGIGAVGDCDVRQLLCPSWVRARSCSALVEPSTASSPPDLAISICWKRSLFCPAFVSFPAPRYFSWRFPS